ncbi:MAG: tetraacyldisaccharide 4'-kinase [Elusimicrobiota bacterium]|jgi:tetraacyldisaccharide 4'-kinase
MPLNEQRKYMKSRLWGRMFLRVFSWIYGGAARLRSTAYALGMLPTMRLPVRIVCIGNLTTGGTGKTTAVLLAVEELLERKHKVAVLSRGYQRKKTSEGVVVLLDSRETGWEETGDEPWMMHKILEGRDVPVLVSPDRIKSGRTALKYYAPQILLLDDGFQHQRLRRDADIVLINALDPFGGGRMLPDGNLREPMSALRRAHLVVLTHADRVPAERLEEIEREVKQYGKSRLRLARAVHKPDYVFDLKRNQHHKLSHLNGKRVACFSAIGDPRPFEDELRRLGAHLEQVWRFPDHHPFTEQELRSIENVRNGIPVVTTLKDFPRLGGNWREILSGEVLALTVKMEITEGREHWEEALLHAGSRKLS